MFPSSASASFSPTARTLFIRPADGFRRRHPHARELYASEPEKYFYADQYSNDANWQAHYHGTAEEIWQQTEGRITDFVAMLGTSGTFMEAHAAERIESRNPLHLAAAGFPIPRHRGAKHMASAIVPKIYDPS